MYKKIYLQLILSLLIFIIILITYLAYFKKDENIVLIEKKNNEILKDTSENLISDLFYQSEDNDGNRYEIKSKNGILSQKRANLISMKDVSATVFLIDGGKIFIISDSAEYDSNNNDTLFKGSVKMNYNDHNIISNYVDLSFEENKAIIYEKINYNSNLSNLKADKIIVDFLEMKVKILMDNKDDKVLVKTILKNGNN
tara:strand:+ start:28 stop:621 length:594 start_codon:yes stop_codon:yes gene_type:complete